MTRIERLGNHGDFFIIFSIFEVLTEFLSFRVELGIEFIQWLVVQFKTAGQNETFYDKIFRLANMAYKFNEG
jgi:hypothetical protein